MNRFFAFLLTFAALLATSSCKDGSTTTKSEIESSTCSEIYKDAPIGSRSYHDVYGPVKRIVYADGSAVDFNEQGESLQMLEDDKKYKEFNKEVLSEGESMIKYDDKGRLISLQDIYTDCYTEFEYNGKYIIKRIFHPNDLGPYESPDYYAYSANGERVASFNAKITPYKVQNKPEDFEVILCMPDILTCQIEYYTILKRDNYGNWTERQTKDLEGNTTTERRTIEYFE